MEINPWDVETSPEPEQPDHMQLDAEAATMQAATFDAVD